MPEFITAANIHDLADGGRKLVEVDDRLVILFRQGSQVYCIDDVCTHDGGTLSDGELEGCEIACPRHGAKFDIRTGKALTMPATEDTAVHDVRIEGDQVMVRIRED